MSLKKYFMPFLFCFCLGIQIPVFASPVSNIEKKEYTATVNGIEIKNKIYENKDHAHMLPLREICQLLNYSVAWQEQSKSVIVTDNGVSVQFTIGIDQYKNSANQSFELNAVPELTNGMTYVPSLFFTRFFPVKMANKENTVIEITGIEKNEVSGTITDTLMDSITIQTEDGKTYRFRTTGADKSQCTGFLTGSKITFTYTGNLEQPDSIAILKITQP